MTKTAGRPTLYKPTYCDKIINYFADFPLYRTRVASERIDKNGDTHKRFEEVTNDYPTLRDFAVSIHVRHCTLLSWAKKFPEFTEALKEAKQIQENIIVKNAFLHRFNSTFSIFALKNIAGWRDHRDDLNKDNENLFDQEIEIFDLKKEKDPEEFKSRLERYTT